MALATYQFYTDTYYGNAISSADFNRLINRANTFLNSIKSVGELPDTDSVKMAQCAVAEEWLKNEQGGEVSSESVGGWSRSFTPSNKSFRKRLFEAAEIYIADKISCVRWA